MDLAIPRSEAIVQFIVPAAVAEILLESAAIELGMESAAGVGVASATGDVALVKGTQAGSRVVVLSMEKLAWATLREIEKNPAMQRDLLRVMNKTDKSLLVRGIKWILSKSEAIAGTAAGAASGAGVVTVATMGAREGLGPIDAFGCVIHGKKMETCAGELKKKVQDKEEGPVVVPPASNWCYKAEAPEIQGYATLEDGRREAYIVRYDNNKMAVTGWRFVLERNETVDPKSIRQFDLVAITEDPTKLIRVTDAKKLVLKDKSFVFKEAEIFPRGELKLGGKGSIQDMKDKIKNRDHIFETETTSVETLNSDLLARLQDGRELIDSQSEEKRKEYDSVKSIKNAELQMRSGCDGVKSALEDIKAMQASSTPNAGPDTATTSTAPEKK